MARPPHLTLNETPFPDMPVIERPRKPRIDPADWTQLANDLWMVLTASYSARQPLEENIKAWEALYELEVAEKDFPWVNCSNLVVPTVPTKLDTLAAQVATQVFVPEFYICNGDDTVGAQNAYKIQRYYNRELRKERPTGTWIEEHMKLLGLGLLHGTSVMEAMWKYRRRRTNYGIRAPKIDPEDGLPMLDERGDPLTEMQIANRDVIDYNAVNLRAVRLRDFMLAPDESTHIESAAACLRCEWFYETDLNAMVREGLMDDEWVQKALAYVPAGISDVSSDRQGYYDKAAGWQLQIGQGQGMMASKFFKNRGPLKVWRIHSDQFDMDGDGFAEENVFWIHELSMYLLGWCPDNYIAPTRPFKAFSPFPRWDRFYGFSLAERLAPMQAEASTIRNQRNDAQDLATSPPLLVNKGEEIHDKNMEWGPGKRWTVSNVENAAKQIVIAQPPAQAYQEEDRVDRYADQLAGLSSPTDGAGTSSRRTATEVKLRQQGTSVKASLVAFFFRTCARSVVEFVHKLNQQNPDPNADGVTKLTSEQLGMNVEITVAGMNDPLNIDENIQEALGLYQLFSKDPDIAGNAVYRYNLKKNILAATHTHNIEGIIGTEEDAVKRQAAEEQQRAQQAQMQQMAAMRGEAPKPGAPPGGGAPPQPGAPGPQSSPPKLAGVA